MCLPPGRVGLVLIVKDLSTANCSARLTKSSRLFSGTIATKEAAARRSSTTAALNPCPVHRPGKQCKGIQLGEAAVLKLEAGNKAANFGANGERSLTIATA
jgi:hypothetical protein